MRREKVKERDKKRESLPSERACFPKKIFRKQPIENKSYFYYDFPWTKDSFPLTSFLCAIKH